MSTNRGQQDPEARLDAAMNETFAELQQSGSGISPTEVQPEAPARRPRRTEREDGGEWFEDERPERRPARRRRDAEPEAASVILDEADDDDDDTGAARSGPRRDSQGRFLPSTRDTDEDEDDDSDEDEDDRRVSGGRRVAADADESEADDGGYETEGRRQADGDEDEDEQPRQRRRRRRFPREVRQEIDKQVRAQVGKIVEERDRLRQVEQQRSSVETQAIGVLLKAIGTQEERARLQQRVNNTRLPLEQRNQAAALLQRYTSNEQYVRTYRTALLADIRNQQANEDKAVAAELAKYKVPLDPAIVAEGKRGKTLIHAVRAGILLERKRNEAENARLRRSDQTRRGVRSEREVRDGLFGRSSLASSNGRRANGRVATVDRLRGALGYDRGLGANSKVAAPTDEILRQLRDGEVTLADLGLG